MQTIHRMGLALEERKTVQLPYFSKVLKIDNVRHWAGAGNQFEMWYTSGENIKPEDLVDFDIIIIGTGQEMPSDARFHLASVTSPGGTFVWHFFSDKMKKAPIK